MRRIVLAFLAVCSLAPAAMLQAAPVDIATLRESATVALSAERRELAQALANRDYVLRQDLIANLSSGKLSVDFKQWLSTAPADAALRSAVARADHAIRVRKGLQSELDSLLQVRLADASMVEALRAGVAPLYAYEPDGNESSWQYIEAFDGAGGVHHLNVHVMPERPVFVVDIDAGKDLAASLKLARAQIALATGRPEPEISTAATTSTPVTILDKIRLASDEEPWISGDAEVYALVAGVDPAVNQPSVSLVDMPYLDTDGRDYFPNQIWIFWDRYRWAAADVILMEHDDNTNYQTILSNVLNIAAQILSTLGYADISVLVGLGSQLVSALPTSWFTNDDDYVDSYYTLLKNQWYTNRLGARGNALVSLRPYDIPAN